MNESALALLGSIIVALISLVGVIYSVKSSTAKMEDKLQSEIKTHMALTDYKLDDLAKEVREHNNFAQKIPLLDSRVRDLTDKVDEIEQNLCKLHGEHREHMQYIRERGGKE